MFYFIHYYLPLPISTIAKIKHEAASLAELSVLGLSTSSKTPGWENWFVTVHSLGCIVLLWKTTLYFWNKNKDGGL